ncbi:MAG: glutathione ABC transporter permease GsiC [SAR324 cluster bacterium]|uniref:Glutathione ABC transporter permease GsiC n=1 Tax=SAR324 cluster bacterium TaxID=2024889 RepID=A0A2D6YHJ8_9DELT|nr:glutathione ABC transporter permease GsiC [SAR324 cluster bacterium]
MGNFLLRRLLLLIPVLWGVATLVFLLLHFIPGDPIDLMLGDSALGTDRETLRDQLGLNDPLIIQYIRYFGDLLQGDWGTSLFSKKPVFEEIMERVPATMELMFGAMVVTILVAMPLGLIAAVKKGTWIDQGSMIFSLLGVSIPNFWLGPMLILLFSIHFDLLPVNERGGLEHLILPALTLGTSLASILARITRSSVVETLQAEYIRTARSKGISELRILLRHALRNALIPIVTVIGLQIGVLLSGAIITESIFDWPGLGNLLISAINSRNYPLVQGCVLFIAGSYVMVNLLIDLLYAYLDPRIRLS